MNQLNSIILEGNAVKDAEVSEPKVGFLVCHFTIGVNRWYKNRDNQGVSEASFFDVEVYGKYAESCKERIKKGQGLRIVGRLKQDRWNDNDGKTHNRVYVIAEHIEYKPKFNTTTVTTEESANSEQPAEKEAVTQEVVKEAVAF